MCRSTYKSVLLYSGGAWNTCACDGVMASPYLVMGCTLYMADRVLAAQGILYKGAVQSSNPRRGFSAGSELCSTVL